MAVTKPLIWQLTFVTVMVVTFLYILRDNFEYAKNLLSTDEHDDSKHVCALEASVAEELRLITPISYAQIRIDVTERKWYQRPGNASRSQELGVTMPALRQLSEFDGEIKAAEDETCTHHATITRPAPLTSSVDASNIVFGVATTLNRLENSLEAFAHWAGHTNAKILSLVDAKPGSAGQIARILRDASDLGIDLKITRQNLSSKATAGDRYFALTKHLHEHRQSQKNSPQWAAFIDDDTFFPSLPALLSRLAQYDPSQPQYIGGLTEDLRQMQRFGYIAYGGAGVFLSMPLLAQINEHFAVCNATGVEGGDKRIADCIYVHTTTKLSVESGLHQTDLHGDASGFYEANRKQPLSLHHWKSWNSVDVVGMSAVSAICGPECLLRRYRFADGWIMVNGFSIFKYSEGYGGVGDGVMEETWRDGGDYSHSLAPLGPKDHGKVSYRLEKSLSGEREVRQLYVKRGRDGEGKGNQVVEVVWKRRR